MVAEKEYVLSKQILRSATSIGANVEEALAGHSKKDFLEKVIISHKEARETRYWLKLIKYGNLVSVPIDDLLNEINEKRAHNDHEKNLLHQSILLMMLYLIKKL